MCIIPIKSSVAARVSASSLGDVGIFATNVDVIKHTIFALRRATLARRWYFSNINTHTHRDRHTNTLQNQLSSAGTNFCKMDTPPNALHKRVRRGNDVVCDSPIKPVTPEVSCTINEFPPKMRRRLRFAAICRDSVCKKRHFSECESSGAPALHYPVALRAIDGAVMFYDRSRVELRLRNKFLGGGGQDWLCETGHYERLAKEHDCRVDGLRERLRE